MLVPGWAPSLHEQQQDSGGAALSGLRKRLWAPQTHLLDWLHLNSLVCLLLGPITPQMVVLPGVSLLSKFLLKPYTSDWFGILTSSQASCLGSLWNLSSAWPCFRFTYSFQYWPICKDQAPSHDPKQSRFKVILVVTLLSASHHHPFVWHSSEHIFSSWANFLESKISLLESESHRMQLRVGWRKGMLRDQFVLTKRPSDQTLFSVSSVHICLGLVSDGLSGLLQD